MKTLLLSLILLFLSAPVLLAQNDDDDDDDWGTHKHNYGTHNHFGIDLGMNNFLENGKNPSGENYEVRPWGSWYIAFKTTNNTHVGGKFHLLWGADLNIYSFKFQNDNTRLVKTDDRLIFTAPDIPDAHKSKLEVIYLNISAVPMLQFGRGHSHNHWGEWEDLSLGSSSDGGFRIGLGMYGGYRLGGKAKYVTKNDGKSKDKDHDNFFLQNWRYGVRFQTGFSNFDFFFNYDLNELFIEGRGPELNAFSFGVIL